MTARLLSLLALCLLLGGCAQAAKRAAAPAQGLGAAATKEEAADHHLEYDLTRIAPSKGDAVPQAVISDVWTEEENARAQVQPSGLRTLDLKPGKGPAVLGDGAQILVHYTLWLTDGTQVDTSRGSPHGPFEVPIPGRLIEGWNVGLLGMQVGGVRKLYVPAKMGYGESGFPPDIGANADLVFEVECLGVGAPPKAQ